MRNKWLIQQIRSNITSLSPQQLPGVYEDGRRDLLDFISAYNVRSIRTIIKRLIQEFAIDSFAEYDYGDIIEILSLLWDVSRTLLAAENSHNKLPHYKEIRVLIGKLTAFSKTTTMIRFWPSANNLSCAHNEYYYAKVCSEVKSYLPSQLQRFRHGDFVEKDKVVEHLSKKLLCSFSRLGAVSLLGVMTMGYLSRTLLDTGLVKGEPSSEREGVLFVGDRLLRQAVHKYLYNLAWRAATDPEVPLDNQPFSPAQWFLLASYIIVLCAGELPSFASYIYSGDQPLTYLTKIILNSELFYERQLPPKATFELISELQKENITSLGLYTMELLDLLYNQQKLLNISDIPVWEKANKESHDMVTGNAIVNSKFLTPMDYLYADVGQSICPKVLAGPSTPLPALNGVGVIENAIQKCRKWQDATDVFEKYVRSLFARGGINLKHGKYLFRKQEAECDGIAIVDNVVFLVEIKWHSINTDARRLSLGALAYDLTESLVSGIRQALRTEMAFREATKLELYNKTARKDQIRKDIIQPEAILTIPTDVRFVRIVVAADVPSVFHNPVVVSNVLEMFYRYDFGVMPSHPNYDQLKKKLDGTQSKLRTMRDYINDLAKIYDNDLRKTLFNCAFMTFGMIYSLSQIGPLDKAIMSYLHTQANDYDFPSFVSLRKMLGAGLTGINENMQRDSSLGSGYSFMV